tara:strand:- start:901 stop:1164 length:264 start_codon:yes stop_codon:yes gene_type:complete
MSDTPTIEFPCEYPIKVIADNHPSMRETVLAIVSRHAQGPVEGSVSVKNSRENTYCSVRVSIVATGEAQLRALHQDLIAEPLVRLVL